MSHHPKTKAHVASMFKERKTLLLSERCASEESVTPSGGQDASEKVTCFIQVNLSTHLETDDATCRWQMSDEEVVESVDIDDESHSDRERENFSSRKESSDLNSQDSNQESEEEIRPNARGSKTEIYAECKICAKRFPTALELVNHVRNCEAVAEYDDDTGSESDQPQRNVNASAKQAFLQCKTCSQRFETAMQLINHARACEITFATRTKRLTTGLDSDESEDSISGTFRPGKQEDVKCIRCGEKFETAERLINHECDAFPLPQQLQGNVDSNEETGPNFPSMKAARGQAVITPKECHLQCKTCDKIFEKATELKNHELKCELSEIDRDGKAKKPGRNEEESEG